MLHKLTKNEIAEQCLNGGDLSDPSITTHNKSVTLNKSRYFFVPQTFVSTTKQPAPKTVTQQSPPFDHHINNNKMPNASPAPSLVPEEPRAFIIMSSSDGGAAFVFDDEAQHGSFSSDGPILPISESGETLPEEFECTELKPKGPLYNIVQNRMNLSEKRGPKYLCHECRYPLHTRLSMVTHMKMHLRPFCEACFAVFDSKEAVHSHIRSVHPEVVLGESKDFYSLQTIAPPNTPTPLSDDEMKAIEGLVNPIVKYPFSFQQEDTEGDVTNEDEPRLVIDDAPRPAQRGRPRKNQQQSPATVKKSLKKKKVKKIRVVEDATPDSVMKKITSRFGRSISLKMPQF